MRADDSLTAVAEQVLDRFHVEITKAVENVATDDPIERFAAVGVAYLHWAIRNPVHFQIISTRSLIGWASSESLRRNNESVRVLMEGALAEAQQGGMLLLQDLIETQAFTNLPWLIAFGFPRPMPYALLMGAGWLIKLVVHPPNAGGAGPLDIGVSAALENGDAGAE